MQVRVENGELVYCLTKPEVKLLTQASDLLSLLRKVNLPQATAAEEAIAAVLAAVSSKDADKEEKTEDSTAAPSTPGLAF